MGIVRSLFLNRSNIRSAVLVSLVYRSRNDHDKGRSQDILYNPSPKSLPTYRMAKRAIAWASDIAYYISMFEKELRRSFPRLLLRRGGDLQAASTSCRSAYEVGT